MSLSGLAQINLELSSRCDKTHLCRMCGHQDETINPDLQYGDMDYGLLKDIRSQLEPGVVIAFHRDGEPTAYPRLGEALRLFEGFTTSLVTHGLNLAKKAAQIIQNCTTVTISVFRADADSMAQFKSVQSFMAVKGDRAPQVQVKVVGDMSEEELAPWRALGVRVIRRLIHVPTGNDRYAHRTPTVPEVGTCLDFLHHPSVSWEGDVFICNRLDPHHGGYLGSLRSESLDQIWNGDTRQRWLRAHQLGRRDLAAPLCKDCTFWGVPSGAQPQIVTAKEIMDHAVAMQLIQLDA